MVLWIMLHESNQRSIVKSRLKETGFSFSVCLFLQGPPTLFTLSQRVMGSKKEAKSLAYFVTKSLGIIRDFEQEHWYR